MDCTNKIHVVYDDGLLGLNGQGYQYLFSYEKGGLESMRFTIRNGCTGHFIQPIGEQRPIMTAVTALTLRVPSGWEQTWRLSASILI